MCNACKALSCSDEFRSVLIVEDKNNEKLSQMRSIFCVNRQAEEAEAEAEVEAEAAAEAAAEAGAEGDIRRDSGAACLLELNKECGAHDTASGDDTTFYYDDPSASPTTFGCRMRTCACVRFLCMDAHVCASMRVQLFACASVCVPVCGRVCVCVCMRSVCCVSAVRHIPKRSLTGRGSGMRVCCVCVCACVRAVCCVTAGYHMPTRPLTGGGKESPPPPPIVGPCTSLSRCLRVS